MKQHEGNPWTVDRRIPLALVLTIMIQTSAGVWWASSISEKVGFNVKTIDRQGAQIELNRTSVNQIDRTNTKLIEQIQHLREDTNDLKKAQIETNVILRELFRQREGK